MTRFTDEGFVGRRWGSRGSGLLFTTGRKILLTQRSGLVEEPYTWGISGGAVPRDARGGFRGDFESALIETEEELGTVPGPYEEIGQVRYEEGDRFVYTNFLLRVPAAAERTIFRLNWENDDARWFTRPELDDLDLHFGVRYVLDRAGDLLFTSGSPARRGGRAASSPRLPVLRRAEVKHVGKLDAPRGRAMASLQGTGLSVSLHPEAWRGIYAKLGGGTTYTLRRKDGEPGVFVDMRRLSKLARVGIGERAVAAGLVRRGHLWRTYWWDDESEEERYADLRTRKEAESLGISDEESPRVEKVPTLLPTAALRAAWREHFGAPLDPAFAEEFARLLILESMGRYDGAWWTDKLDVYNLSAPRGVIFQSKLPEWTWKAEGKGR